MVYASDYPTAAAYRAALIKEFNTVGDLHLIRAQYQLERECQLQDTFAALQQYQQSTGVQLIDSQFFGFEGYTPPVGFRTYTVTNSYYTTITNLPTSTAVGSSVTLTVGPATPYTFVNLNVGLKITNLGVVVSELTAVANNNISVIKYLSKVENLTSILKTTLSKHFSKCKEPYKNNQYTVHKCINVDLKGYFKNNFR